MANQEQNPPQQEQPFVAAKQVGFNLEDIILNTNNEFSLLYPEHTNKDFFKCVSDFISLYCLREPFTRSPNMYKEYIVEFWYSTKALKHTKVSFLIPTGGIYEEVRVNTFINAIGAHYLSHSSEYVAPPSIDTVRKWFETIGKEATIGRSSKAPTDSKTGHLKKKKDSSSTMESNLSQTSGIDEGNKNTSFDHISAGKKASSIARQVDEEEASRIIKLKDLENLVSHVQPSFKDLDSSEDDLIIVVDDSDEDEEADKDEIHTTTNDETKDASSQKYKLELEKNKAEAEATLLRAQPSFPNIGQLNELLVKSLQIEFSKILFAHDFSGSLPTELKELFFKFNELTKEVKGLKKQVHNLETELPGELKEIPTKLEDFTKTVTSLTSQETEKESIDTNSDDDETYVTGSMSESSRIKKVKKFNFVTEDGKHIHLTKEQINQQKKIKEEAKAKAAKHESEVRKEKLVDILGPKVVNKYYNDKLQYDRYYDKMLNRKQNQKSICSRMDYIHITKAELDINMDIPLSKQDPLDKLNDLANKKRKHADDIHYYLKENKKLKSSVQYEDHLAGIVLNELVFGPGLDDHARTISSLLPAEIDKRNLNPLKQMRTIEQPRQ
nr:hypothetical protein [Tanacetum cinerariifolium]